MIYIFGVCFLCASVFFIYTLWGGEGKARRGGGGEGLDFTKRKQMAKMPYSLKLRGRRMSEPYRDEWHQPAGSEANLR